MRLLSSVMVLIVCAGFFGGCTFLRVNIGSHGENQLREVTVKGKGKQKVLVVPIRGVLSDAPEKGVLGERPSIVQEVVARLNKAEKDESVKAVVLEINSPGGSVTASDILYHDISRFKERTGRKVVASFMDVAASGAYYLALAADRIIAHPTCITGSIGVVMVTPKVPALMEKLGIGVEVTKSGSQKDIGSPFRLSTVEEKAIFQEVVDRLSTRFLDLVSSNRKIGSRILPDIASARIYPADSALRLGLVDGIGYLDDAIKEARMLASITEESKVITYRRSKPKDDTVYNTTLSEGHQGVGSLIDMNLLGIFGSRLALPPGPYYLWLPGGFGE